MSDQKELVQIADRVQTLLLQDFERILSEPALCSPTDRATIARYLKDNGFRVDPNNLPKSLADLVASTRAKRELPDPSKLPGE
jgi:hypothetical protein